MNFDVLVFWILLIDAISSTVTMWTGPDWYAHNFRILSRLFPPSRGWPLLYLALVLWAGSILWRSGAMHL